MIEENPLDIQHIPTDVEKYQELCVDAVIGNPEAIRIINHASIKEYEKFCCDVLRYAKSISLKDIKKEYLTHEEYKTVCRAAVCRSNSEDMKYINIEDIDDYYEFSYDAVTYSPRQLKYINREEINNSRSEMINPFSEICEAALRVGDGEMALEFIPRDMPLYENYCRRAVRGNGLALQFVPTDIEKYDELCRIAVQNNGLALQFISTDIKGYQELVEMAVENNGLALQFVSPDNPNYDQLCEKAVQNNAFAIEFVSPEVEDYRKLCGIAVRENGIVIQYIPEEVEGYEFLENDAVNSNIYALKFVPRLQNNPDVARKIASKRTGTPWGDKTYEEVFEYVSEDIRGNVDLMLELIQDNPRIMLYMTDSLKNDPEALLKIGSSNFLARDLIINRILPQEDKQEFKEKCKLTRNANKERLESLMQEKAELEARIAEAELLVGKKSNSITK